MNLGIDVVDTPPHDREFQIDEKVLDASLEEEINYINPRARQYDVDSIRSVYTLRGGKAPTALERSIAVLVTTNSSLARSAYVFGQKFESSKEVSTVVSSFGIANIAWLKGGKLTSAFPKVEMMALAYAALRPSNALWDKYISKCREMAKRGYVRPQDHALLRFSPMIQTELMNLTLGLEERITDSTITELVERAEASIVKEEREFRLKERTEHQLHMKAKEIEIAGLDQQRQLLLANLDRALDAYRSNLHKANGLANSVATFVRWSSLSGSVVAYLFLAYGLGLFGPGSPWKHLFSAIFLIVSTVLTITGATPTGWSKKLGEAVRRRTFTLMTAKYLPPIQLTDAKLLPGASREDDPPRPVDTQTV
jgi:hypothetical protein